MWKIGREARRPVGIRRPAKAAQVRSLYLPWKVGRVVRHRPAKAKSAAAAQVRSLYLPSHHGGQTGQACRSRFEPGLSREAWGSCPLFSVWKVNRLGVGPASKAVRARAWGSCPPPSVQGSVAQLAEAPDSSPGGCGFDSHRSYYTMSLGAPMAERSDSGSDDCGFDSLPRYQLPVCANGRAAGFKTPWLWVRLPRRVWCQ